MKSVLAGSVIAALTVGEGALDYAGLGFVAQSRAAEAADDDAYTPTGGSSS